MEEKYGVENMQNVKVPKSQAPQGIQPMGGGALSSNAHYERVVDNFDLRPNSGRRWHEVPDEGDNHTSQGQHNFTCIAILRAFALRMTAFTLAEVLITLGIIGVVAALTLPGVISKFQMKAFEVAFKKEYSVLNNTIDFLQLDENLDNCYLTFITCPTPENPNNGCYSSNNSDCMVLKQGMIDKLKLTPIKNYNVVYPKASDVLADGGYAINSTVDYDAVVANSSTYLFPDGTILKTITRSGYDWGMKHVNFVVDVNGKKGPNKWGYDVFFLTLTQNNGKLRLTDEYASLAQKGGRLPRTILLNKDTNNKNNSWHW